MTPEPTKEQIEDAYELCENSVSYHSQPERDFDPCLRCRAISSFLAARDARLRAEDQARIKELEDTIRQREKDCCDFTDKKLKARCEAAESKLTALSSENAALKERVAGLVATVERAHFGIDYFQQRFRDEMTTEMNDILLDHLNRWTEAGTGDSLPLLQARLAEERRPLVEALDALLSHCDMKPEGESRFEQDVNRARAILAKHTEESRG